jgi:hypothetical protein
MPASNLIAFLRLESSRNLTDARLLRMQVVEYPKHLQDLKDLGMTMNDAVTLFRELHDFNISSATYTDADKAIQQNINILANSVNDSIVDKLFIFKMPVGWKSPY